jgi:hypothetical protein
VLRESNYLEIVKKLGKVKNPKKLNFIDEISTFLNGFIFFSEH